MTAFKCGLFFLVLVLHANLSSAQTVQGEECIKFNVLFDEKLSVAPSGVYAGAERIGTAKLAEKESAGFQGLVICIDKKHSKVIRTSSICYISGDRLAVYNVWSTGEGLREGGSLQGFPSRYSVYMYEARTFLQAAMDFSVSFIREQLGKLFGEKHELNKSL